MIYSEAVQYLYDRLPVFHQIGGAAYKPGLGNTIKLLDALNNPQQTYKTIHIAGTNGKGSVSHMLASVLQHAGYKVGLYTSPHLVDFGERIRVNGQQISPDYVVEFVERNQRLFDEVQPSFFEATMSMAFAYFAEERVDVAVIETGLGGRLDSTNIIKPELSVITNISFDHTGFLGDTLEKIAVEKAGIIKQNTPVVIGEAVAETRPVFVKQAGEKQAPLFFAEEKLWVVSHAYEGDKMQVVMSDGNVYRMDLTGIYQLKNIVTVLVAIERLNKNGFLISENAVHSGLKTVVKTTGLRGRWQVVSERPKIVLDTGHNVGGIQFVIHQLQREAYRKLRIVIGMVNDKDISTVLSLLPKDALYYFTQAQVNRALPAEDLLQQARHYDLKGKSFTTIPDAISQAMEDMTSDDFLFIGGSNFVVGEALQYLSYLVSQ